MAENPQNFEKQPAALEAQPERMDSPLSSGGDRFQAPDNINNLISKERANDNGQGPALSGKESASLNAWRTFPNPADEQFRNLQEKSLLAQNKLGPELSAQEQAQLYAKLTFPEARDEQYRKLHEKNLLADRGGGPELTKDEKARLYSKFAFPEAKDEGYRILHEREMKGTDPLSEREQSRLSSKRAFPNNEQARQLWEQDLNARKNLGPELTREEKFTLQEAFARQHAREVARQRK